MLGWSFALFRHKSLHDHLNLLLVGGFPEDQWIVPFVDPARKPFFTETTHSLVVDVEVAVTFAHIMGMIWFLITGLQHYSGLRYGPGYLIIFAGTLNDTLEVVVEDNVVSSSRYGYVEFLLLNVLYRVVQKGLCQIVLAVMVLEVYCDEDAAVLEQWAQVLSLQHHDEFVASIECVVEVGSGGGITSETQAADLLGIVIESLTGIPGLPPGRIL